MLQESIANTIISLSSDSLSVEYVNILYYQSVVYLRENLSTALASILEYSVAKKEDI